MSGPTQAGGTAISIGTTAATASSDTYVAIGSLATISEFGMDHDEITFDDLTAYNRLKFKGARNDGTITLQLGMDTGNAGQVAILAAAAAKDDYNFKIVFNDQEIGGSTPTTVYLKAKVQSYQLNPGGLNSTVGASVKLSVKSGSVAITART